MHRVGLSIAHHPKAKGASYGAFNEHDESAIWTNNVIELLKESGISYHLAPIGKLPTKVLSLNKIPCSLVLEIHFNSVEGGGASGCESLYHPGSAKGKAAATIMQRCLPLAMGNVDRGIKEGWHRMDRPGIIDWYGDKDGDEMPNYFLRKTLAPALIIEPEFIQQVALITGARDRGARAIVTAIGEILQDVCSEVEDTAAGRYSRKGSVIE